MKKFYKGIVAAVLLVALISSTVGTSYAAGIGVVVDAIMGGVVDKVIDYTFKPTTVNEGEDEIVAAMNYLNSVWRTPGNCTGTVDVTYQTMSDLVADLNMNGIPCQIGMWRGSGATGYVIRGTGKAPVCGGVAKVDITGKYLTNTVGAAFLAKSKSEITTPDTSTTTPTTPTITFDDTNIVNAVEGVFDQLTWVIRCQFEQMQDTLLNGRILLNLNNLISKNVIPFLEDILVADTATSSTLQALYHSFESKFSDLDTIFGTDTSMEVHNGDLLTWDNLSRGFTSAEADGTATTIRLTPTRTLSGYNVGWTSDGNFSITPVGGGYFPDTLDVGTGTVTMPVTQTTETTTVANPKLNQYVPEGYTQYEDYLANDVNPIDLGITAQEGMKLQASIAIRRSATSPSKPQYIFGRNGLSMAISQDGQALEVTSGSSSYRYTYDFTQGKTVSLFIYWTLGSSWRTGTMMNAASLPGFSASASTLHLGYANGYSVWDGTTRNGASSTWGDITITDSSDNLLYAFVPVKRDSDGAEGLYRVEYSAGTYSGGTFLTSGSGAVYDEIPATVETTVTTPGNITRIYRDTSNTWRAVDSEGTVHGFTAASAQVLWEAFPIYDYDDLSDLPSLPDGTYRFTWEETAQAVIIKYQAYSKWFAYIANQIAYNRNWLDQRLDRLPVSEPAEPADLTPVIEGITSVTTAQGEMLNSMSAFLASFNSKFSDLDDAFGADSVMEIPNGGTLSWDSASRGFTSAAAIGGTVSDLRLTPAITVDGCNLGWDTDGKFIITPSSGEYLPDTLQAGSDSISMPDTAIYETVTVPNPALNSNVPEGYTQYARFAASGKSISLGIDAESGVSFSGKLTPCYAASSSASQTTVLSAGGTLAVTLSKESSASRFYIGYRDGSASGILSTTTASKANSIYCTVGQSLSINSSSRPLYTAPTSTAFTIGSSSGMLSVYWESVSVRASGVLYTFVPCKNASGTAGLYRASSSGGEFIPVTSGFTVYSELPETVEQQVTKAGHIVKVYREAPGEWYAVDTDGTTHAFDTAAAAKLDRVFPSYVYASLDELTTLPDGSWRASWSGDAAALSIEYQAYSKFFAYLSNQMTYNRNWLDKRLDQLSFSTGDITMSPTDLTDVTVRMDTIIDLLQATSGDTACEHTYEQDMTTEATCALPGLMVSTCSKCGDSYSEIVDPLGHDWQCTDHVAAETDPETGEETAAAYDIYTCSRCGDTSNDYSGDGAPEDYGKSSISQLIVELFSRLGKLVGSLLGFVVNVFDKALTSVDDLISRFNSYTEQITGFGGAYPAWLGGVWGIFPADLQVALTFAVVCMAVALVGKKLVFS